MATILILPTFNVGFPAPHTSNFSVTWYQLTNYYKQTYGDVWWYILKFCFTHFLKQTNILTAWTSMGEI